MRVDFNLPKRFNITYTGTDSKEHEVVMIHRALLGAIERFFAILIEHCSGNFPVWLAPTQVTVLPVSSGQVRYAERIQGKLLAHGIRSMLDNGASTIGYRIRQSEVQKVPYMAICGKREAKMNGLSVRKHGIGDIGFLTVRELVKKIRSESV
jgi:threonyl-tRNA synthetase